LNELCDRTQYDKGILFGTKRIASLEKPNWEMLCCSRQKEEDKEIWEEEQTVSEPMVESSEQVSEWLLGDCGMPAGCISSWG